MGNNIENNLREIFNRNPEIRDAFPPYIQEIDRKYRNIYKKAPFKHLPEWELEKYLLDHPEAKIILVCCGPNDLFKPSNLVNHPYLFDFEYDVDPNYSQFGRGDMIFTDGNGSFIIVEVKFVDGLSSGKNAREKRRKKRRKVEE